MEGGFFCFCSLFVFSSSRYFAFTLRCFVIVFLSSLRAYLGPGSISVLRGPLLDSMNFLRPFTPSPNIPTTTTTKTLYSNEQVYSLLLPLHRYANTMKLFILTTIFLAGSAVAGSCTCADSTPVRPLSSSTPPTPIPDNEPCMPDGSMGTCKSKIRIASIVKYRKAMV